MPMALSKSEQAPTSMSSSLSETEGQCAILDIVDGPFANGLQRPFVSPTGSP
jgi:hypothetical protein